MIARRDRTRVAEAQEAYGPAGARRGRPGSRAAEAPEGGIIVPLDAWNAMLRQLGNLHQAGQELAEARERAARAEAERDFLKERLYEARRPTPTSGRLWRKPQTIPAGRLTRIEPPRLSRWEMALELEAISF